MLQNVAGALTLNRRFYNTVENDSRFNFDAALVVVLGAVSWAVHGALRPGNQELLASMWRSALLALGVWLVFSGVAMIVGRLLGGDGDLGQVARALGFAFAPMLLFFIPLVGNFIVWPYVLVTATVAIDEAHDFTFGKAILTTAAGVAAAFAGAFYFGNNFIGF